MKIRTQLIAGMVIFGLLLVILSGLVIATNQQVEGLLNQEEIANRIALDVGELSYLTNDYILYHEPQQAERWNAKFSSMSNHIAGLSVDQPEQRAIVDDMKANLRNIKSVFDDISSHPLQSGSTETGFVQLSWSRMAVQDRAMVFDADRLARSLSEQASGLQQVRLLFIITLMGAYIAMLLTAYFFLYRRALKSITGLQEGARIIGSGNLDFTIEENGEDEIGAVSHAFNHMTANLKLVTASKDELEKEIEERKRAEVALKKSEDLLNETGRMAQVGGWEFDVTTLNQVWTDEVYQIHEVEPGFMPTVEAGIDFHAPESRPVIAEAVRRAIELGEPFDVELAFITAKGNRRWVHTIGKALRVAGKTVKVSGTFQDITERKQAEEALRESEEKFRHAFDDTAIGMAITEPDGRLTLVNRALCAMLGYTKSELVGKNFQDITHPEDIILKTDAVLELLSAPQDVVNFEKRFLRKSGEVVWGAVNSILIHDSSGLPSYFIVHIQDITRQKTDAETIAFANRKLTLMNDVTYQDIQNKVTALRGYTELSRDARTEAERAAFIGKEEKILSDIHQLIKHTKQYQEMGLTQSRWIPVEEEIRMAAALTSPENPISIDIDLHGLELYTDPLIGKIFFHLIDNAMKHGAGLSRITFSCHETPDGLVLVCDDDGAGIDPGKRATLFSRITGDKARFGLFFVKESLLLSGMAIAETSEPGKGARFEITVPKGEYRFTGS